MSDIIRTFIGFELPENIISAIGSVQEGLKSYGLKVRWVRPKNIHLTLKFLGDIKVFDIKNVGQVITESVKENGPISLQAKGIGLFPGIKRPRVIWIGLAGQMEPLIGLQKNLDENLERIGFPKENRPFKGHLTLGRIKGKLNPKTLADAIKEFERFESEVFDLSRIILFKSELTPKGSIYTELMSASLGQEQ